MSELRHTPLHAAHVRLGGRLVDFAGFALPVQYESIRAEHEAVRERAGLFDVSHMGQIHLSGPGAIDAAERLVTCEVASLKVGRARYGLVLRDDGGCLDDVMVTRLAEDEVFLCVNGANVAKVDAWTRERTGGVRVDDRSDETALLALQGPAAATVLERLVSGRGSEDARSGASEGASALPRRFRVTRVELAGVPVLVSGTGYTGSPGFEVYVDAGDALKLYDAVLEAGQPEDVRPAGLGARDTLRLEAALPLYGHELDETTTPIEAGLERFVKLERGGFIGAEALAAAPRDDTARRLVGFEVTGRGIPRAGYDIVHEGEVVGHVTSGAPSPTLGKSIGLGYVPRSLGAVGRTLEIRVRSRDVPARVVETPFYKAPRRTA